MEIDDLFTDDRRLYCKWIHSGTRFYGKTYLWETFFMYYDNVFTAYVISMNDFTEVVNLISNRFRNINKKLGTTIKEFLTNKYLGYLTNLTATKDIPTVLKSDSNINKKGNCNFYKLIFPSAKLEIFLSKATNSIIIKIYSNHYFSNYCDRKGYMCWFEFMNNAAGEIKIYKMKDESIVDSILKDVIANGLDDSNIKSIVEYIKKIRQSHTNQNEKK